MIAILAAAIFVAIDPARRLHESRNARRRSDIATILDAVRKYQTDNSGVHYTTVAALTASYYYRIGTATTGCNTTCASQTPQAACVNLSSMPTNYLSTVPKDPKDGTDADTGYMMMIDTTGAVTVYVCDPEGEGAGGAGTAPTINITR